ncbi:hypothetical protein ABNP34_01140 [Glutamicibacter mishrai]|uniref:hypothetical protein n=1 Tax=Glutamicibacter mishrai TaxID=1775880 RepID=UPI0032EC58F5
MKIDKKSNEAFEVVIDGLFEIDKPDWSTTLRILKERIEATSDALEILRLKKLVGGLVRAGWGGVDDMSIPNNKEKDGAFFSSIIILRKFSRTNFIDAVIARIIREKKS